MTLTTIFLCSLLPGGHRHVCRHTFVPLVCEWSAHYGQGYVATAVKPDSLLHHVRGRVCNKDFKIYDCKQTSTASQQFARFENSRWQHLPPLPPFTTVATIYHSCHHLPPLSPFTTVVTIYHRKLWQRPFTKRQIAASLKQKTYSHKSKRINNFQFQG